MKAIAKALRGIFGLVVFLPAMILYFIGAGVGILFALMFLGFDDGAGKIRRRRR